MAVWSPDFARALRVGVFVSLVLAPGVVLSVWGASAKRELCPSAQPYDGGQRPTAQAGGRPKCVRVGTRSEGWAWPSGKFIRWAKCKGVTPTCRVAGASRKNEGWYAGATFIAPDRCSERKDTHR